MMGMMTGRQVVDVLRGFTQAGITAWVDGGWRIDALLGAQTRQHDDLDLVVPAGDVCYARELLLECGFAIERDWLPTALALRHPDDRAVDLHPIRPTPDGGGDQAQPDGSRWHYDLPVTGRIDGHRVRCCSPECQMAAHLGYQPDDTDRADIAALASRYGLTLPPGYRYG
jgi:lincosamide nucleotidyltransferase A/C/D/E